MQSMLNPYLNFNGNARDAMSFYQSIFGGTLDVTSYKELHASQDPSEDDLVMHAVLKAPNGITVMAADIPHRMEYRPGANVSLSVNGDNEAELRGYFDKLSADGSITMPFEKAMWGDYFGMCTDKFGMNWMVNVSQTPTAAA